MIDMTNSDAGAPAAAAAAVAVVCVRPVSKKALLNAATMALHVAHSAAHTVNAATSLK